MSHTSGVQLFSTQFPPGAGGSRAGSTEGANQFRADFAAQRQHAGQGSISGGAGVEPTQIRPPATPTAQIPLPGNVPSADGYLSAGPVARGGAGLPLPGNSVPVPGDASGKTVLTGDPLLSLSNHGTDVETILPAAQVVVSSIRGETTLEEPAADTELDPEFTQSPGASTDLVPEALASGQERVVPALFKGAFDHSPHAGKIREHLQTVPGGKLTSVPHANSVTPDPGRFPVSGAMVAAGESLVEIPGAQVAPKLDAGAKVSGETVPSAAASSVGHTAVGNLLTSLTAGPAPAAPGALIPFAPQSGDTGSGHIPTLALHTPAGAPGWTGELGNQIRWLLERSGQVAELRLNPAELGSVDVKLSKDGDSTNVMFYTANAHARELLEAALPRLRDMFTAQGMNLGEADVFEQSLAQQQASQHAHNPGGDGSRRNSIPGTVDNFGDSGIAATTTALTQRLIDYYV